MFGKIVKNLYENVVDLKNITINRARRIDLFGDGVYSKSSRAIPARGVGPA